MTQYHILLVDDEDSLRELTQLALETLGGHRVSAFASGAEAVRCARGQVFDLLLLDIMMPEMGGVDTLAALRELPGLAQIPAVFLTARTQARELEAYRRYRVADVIAKPFDPVFLCDRISRVLQASTPPRVPTARMAITDEPEALVRHEVGVGACVSGRDEVRGSAFGRHQLDDEQR